MTRMGRPPKKPEDRSQIQRIAVKKKTYHRIKYNAAKKDLNNMEYLDKLVPKEKEYKEY